ncbi:MAG: glycosyltransferase family 4 protein [Lachnospiraceae bacterium]|nr:glycosyltransferase family 4 protein [Lachnospiraceae bacterium]
MEKGHTPIIITAGDINENTYYDGIEVIRRNTRIDIDEKYQIVSYVVNALNMSFRLNKELKVLLKKKKIDIIQFCSLYGLGFFYCGMVPAIVRLSSYAKESFAYSETYSKLMIRIMSIFEKLGSHSSRGIISPSDFIGTSYGKDVDRKVITIESPFNNNLIVENDSIYKQKFMNKKYILYYGVLSEDKGVIVLSKIIHKILEKNPEYYFAFIGRSAKYKNENVVKIVRMNAGEYKDRLICMEPLEHDKLYPVIRNAELVVLPSLAENLSNACIESMALGKVVIGTNGTSFEQLIVDGKSGLLSILNDAESLYQKIEQAINLSEVEKEEMQERAKERIAELAPDKVVGKLIRYYNYIIENQKKRRK